MSLIVAALVLDVSAATTAPATLKAGSKTASIGPYDGLSTHFGLKTYIENGQEKYAYCINDITKSAPHNVTLTRSRELDAGYLYLIKNGYPSKSITGGAGKDYYITQAAVWWYTDSIGGNTGLGSSYKNSNVTSSVQSKKLVNGALNARTKGYAKPSLKLSASSVVLTKTSDNKYYQSGLITVSTSSVSGNYKVTLSNAPSGTIIVDANGKSKSSFGTNEKFRIKVPTEKLTKLSYSFTATISATGSVEKAYEYKSSNSGLQSLLIARSYVETTALSAKIKFSLSDTKVKISKQDITNKKELPGATLVVKDNTGNIIDKWVSTNEPHYLSGLTAGKYTLTETIAPDGYELSTETITFEVKNGQTTSTVMYNAPLKESAVKISKQDITNKKELPGATLVIKDTTGNVIDKWVSTSEPHYIKDLKPGKYTLTETIAPNGYELSTETITFEVKYGKLTSIVMYNAPKKVTVVKISKQDITNKKELPGATLELKDNSGKLINTWVSTNEPYYISGLKPGKYTLTETIAPKGYELSTETIEFEVKDDGKITTVVMYNEPKKKEDPKEEIVEVPITDTNIPPFIYVAGLAIMATGTFIVIKTAKKENK